MSRNLSMYMDGRTIIYNGENETTVGILRYYLDESIFREENGSLKPEPEETLDELEAARERLCNCYREVKARLKELQKDGSDTDPDDNDDESFDLSLAEFNSSEAIEFAEWEIDLKLLHIHYRNH